MKEYFTITKDGHTVFCRICRNKKVRRVILCGHGFAGSKDSGSADQLASRVLKKCHDAAIVSFDWPAHGNDENAQQDLSLSMKYIRIVTDYIRNQFQPEKLSGFGVSFGGYQFLKYISEYGSPFDKAVFRCPAVIMYDVLTKTIMTPEQMKQCEKGDTVQAGFANQVPVSREFLQELHDCDITKRDYTKYAGDMLIIHGTADEIVPFAAVQKFADDNRIRLIASEGTDHRFTDPAAMDLAAEKVIEFFDLQKEHA